MEKTSSSERLVRVINEHWVIYVVPVVVSFILFVISFGLFFLAQSTAYHIEWLWALSFALGTVFLLVALHGLFLFLLNESLSQIVVTNIRVIRFHDSMPFTEKMLEVTFDKMKTVEAKKHGILQTLLNYGSLDFEKGKAVIDYVPHPNSVVRDIEQAMGAQ